jgi:hypothetical protein
MTSKKLFDIDIPTEKMWARFERRLKEMSE